MKKNAKDLKRGDVILAIDGHAIPNAETRRITVTKYIEPTGTGTHHVHVEDPNCKASSPDRYLQGVITYGRLVTLSGHRMLKTDEDRYVSLCGQYEVYRDDSFPTYCDDPHPVKITAKDRERYRAVLAEYNRDHNRVAAICGRDWADACRDYGTSYYDYDKGKRVVVKGYYCYGGEEHTYSLWTAWAPETREEFGQEWADTATDAADYLPEGV